ncbi:MULTISPECIES: SdpI family protein [unclassified Microbacterium]|uniref:SdpI family protein n=1 Tax=unclassified Microbacterium TaxID=2609290 RepID=UPI000EA8E4AC|nr:MULTISPECIES: SdpI family protein [unclassified Microbacterium]MBT2486180.1 SdpI family protein [Microbacterium sp. ISL-108]RKN68905.1 SdpI family protein [Microbacterium sp. CGR2]
MDVVAAVFPALLLVIAVTVQLAAQGLLHRNRVAGIRTIATMKSDAAWVAAHRSASLTVWLGFVASVVTAIVTFAAEGLNSIIGGVAVAVVFFATSVGALVVANRAGAAVASA